MKLLTKDNFEEAKKGKSLTFFFRAKGCGNCTATKPFIESFVKDGVDVYGMDGDENREILSQYAPQGKWNFPLIVYMEDGKVINKSTGAADDVKILELTKTIKNISDVELENHRLDVTIEVANLNKKLFERKVYLFSLEKEIELRSVPQEANTGDSSRTDYAPKTSTPIFEPLPEIIDPAEDKEFVSCQ